MSFPPREPLPWMLPEPRVADSPVPEPRAWWCELCSRVVGRSAQEVCAACGGDDE